MRRGYFLVWMSILGIVGLLWAVNLEAQPDDISLDDNEVFTSRSRPAVEFPHLRHFDDASIECSECHHRFKDGENIVDEGELEEDAEGIKCSSCHKGEAGFRFKPDLEPTKLTLQQAYHRMCTSCHRQLKKENKTAGSVTCGGCHPKKKAAQS
ncbi:MAG: cytochrome c3 family protein [Syntrophobacterales bacterium]